MIHNIFKKVRQVQVKQVQYDPNLFKLLFVEKKYNIEYDESDDIEKQKKLRAFAKPNKN